VPKFSPCAASRLVAQSQIDSLIANGLIFVVPMFLLLIKKSFGPIMEDVDHKSKIPDFISNCGMARVFAYFMEKVQMTDEAIFHDTSEIIKQF
jgi:hypothetical protein